MRRIDKPADSKVLSKKLTYKDGGDNKKLAQALCDEQFNICAYTETYLGRADKKDIEHFNPTIKGTLDDNYENWFLVKAQWNSEKGKKWVDFQPVLYPTAHDFEQRIIYFEGNYDTANPNDLEATNLIQLLKLDDPLLADTRKRYIQRIKSTINYSGKTNQDFIDDLLVTDPDGLYFIRAIEEELNVKVNFDLLRTK
ncbi:MULTISPECIES: hypothetical protein [unclassified Spirosoma]|uniref:hypothetical protein n=1 Tax=unclassified Spirosoma TaxID=2621999 RepID=UPI000964C3E3|nr:MULTISPECIES: hypothetical protein [unclassified Spirosoma]MBN8824833.1 hypothetical protein [Spirosoma sp.]OJW77018.1 MAG: hypothetical protein BGO59_23485 [Spirosoma sp. 48-14]